MSESNVESLEKLVHDATDDRTGWDAVDFCNTDFGDSHTEQEARQLERLVLAGRGKVWRVDDPREVAHAMSEAQLGRSTFVAKEARLTVRFNPGAVKSYRLIGHEAHAVGGLVSGPLEASFQLGDASTALFELELKPNGSDRVAEVTLAWKDPTKTGQPVRLQQVVRRLQFVTKFEQAPRSLQMAAIAGATAEILRASPYISSESDALASVLKLADRLDPSLADNESLREFLGVVELAQRGGRARP
jgi:Ca-activated chloride channel family protein